MKITENKKGRCTGCCAAALFAGLDGTYDFLLVAPVFLHPAEKDAKNHLTNCYGGGYYIGKAGSAKKVMGACQKKIVRLIFMSNISRRSFLKGAGVAALAVAAAGVLAGCSDKETPDTGAKRDVKLKYLSTSAGEVFGDVIIQVPALATTVSFATIQANKPAAAEGYDFISTEDGKIDDKGIVTINMVVKQAPKVEVQVKYMLVDFGTATELNATDSKLDGAKLKVSVAAGTTKIDTADLLPATSTLAICDAQHMPTTEGLVNGAVTNGIATVYVYKK